VSHKSDDVSVTWTETDIDLVVQLDRRTVVMTGAAYELPPTAYRARKMRLYGVRIDARDGVMMGEVWFGLEYERERVSEDEEDLVWVRAAECGPAQEYSAEPIDV
jgi:hypothetical protein